MTSWRSALVALALPALASASLAVSASTAAADDSAWQVDLSRSDSTSSNVATAGGVVRLAGGAARAASAGLDQRMGIAEYDLHTLAAPANTFAATVRSDVPGGSELAVDVQGVNQDGTTTEWTEVRPDAPAVLPTAVSTVAVRVVLTAPSHGASPTLRALTLRASAGKAQATAGVAALTAGRSYRVYATREGLVGGTTANGHTIASRDHFVALPSRRGLSSNGSGSFSVRVCASNGRCEWAPVWDVGPWNTNDDYWNPAGTRERFGDLAQGLPEAQAAYQNGYNGGHDQFGRTVTNPAGIDLADGTFLDGLALADNSFVTVTYEWTGTLPAGTVRTSGGTLNVRSGTSTSNSIVGLAANSAQVRVECQQSGQSVTGTQGTSSIWYRIASGKWIARAYVSGVSGATAC